MQAGKAAAWAGGILLVAIVAGVPLLSGRLHYDQFKRLRVVADHRLYRSGQLTADGFRQAHHKYAFKTVVNLQEEAEAVDPIIPKSPLDKSKTTESEVCRELGIDFVPLRGGVLDRDGSGGRPELVDAIFEIFDDDDRYPILFHCRAGLHRTGLICAIYRMEYDGWSRGRALEELRANGFGTYKSTNDNAYIQRYLFEFVPGVRRDGYRWPLHPAPRRTHRTEPPR